MDEEMDRFIDTLHAIKAERSYGGSGADAQQAADRLISRLVAASKNLSSGAPSVYSEIARRILDAEKNWNRETGKSHCGQMLPPT